MSNPFIVGAPGDGMAKRIEKYAIRTYKKIYVPNSREWEACMHISEALNNQHVWIWLDRRNGIRLYGRFQNGCVEMTTQKREEIIPIFNFSLTDVEQYKNSVTIWDRNSTTLRPHESHSSNRKIPHTYNFDLLDASVKFEYIVKPTRTDKGEASHFYDKSDHISYTARRITSRDNKEIYNLYECNEFCNDKSRFNALKFPVGIQNTIDGRPEKINDFEGGVVLQVALTSNYVPRDHILRVPNKFWSHSKHAEEITDSGLLTTLACYTDRDNTESGRKTPGEYDSPWPWDL